jgi:hypothetical protein
MSVMGRVVMVVVGAAALLGMSYVVKTYVLPRFGVEAQLERAEADLVAIPAFQLIRQHDRATYDGFMNDLKAGIRAGKSHDQVVLELKPRMEQFVIKRLPIASDKAVTQYVAVMAKELRFLTSKDPDLCFKFLFPQQYGPINIQQHVPQELIDADLAALAALVKSSAEAPQAIPTQADVGDDLAAAFAPLQQKHGDKLAVLDNPTDPSVDKAEACGIFGDLYETILTLPEQRSSRVLRFMFSQV